MRLQLSGHALASDSAEVELPADSGETYQARQKQAGKQSNPIVLDVDELPEFLATAEGSRGAHVAETSIDVVSLNPGDSK